MWSARSEAILGALCRRLVQVRANGNDFDRQIAQKAIIGMRNVEQTLIGASSECEDALQAFVDAFGSAEEMNAAYNCLFS